MNNIKFYEIDEKYINYLSGFAPLSSFKQKHYAMKESIDFIKIKNYAVINLNNMFPAPESTRKYVDIGSQPDLRYRSLLLAEYRYIKSIQEKIRKNAQALYKIKLKDKNTTSLAKRCNDFKALEKASENFKK